MGFSFWLAGLRSFSKKSAFSNALRNSSYLKKFQFSTSQNNLPSTIAEKCKTQFFSWSSSLLPLALAASAGSLAFQSQNIQPSLCEPSNLDSRKVSIGRKSSTEFVVKGIHKEVTQELIDELKAICQDNMTLDYDERFYHGKPQNSFHKAVNIPDVVVFPRSEEEVSQIVKSCDKHKVPIVPYGGATSIEGHTLSPNGGVCIDMTLMKRVKALHIEDMDVVVEPGIGWMELNEYLEPYGLFFPLDPGPGATIGGMCATRCSGSLAVRYGTMRDNVISLKVVLANGDIVKTASRARKSAAGYDLTRLMIGSEGTLGVVTEVTLRLQKIPEHSVIRKEALWACFTMEPNFEAMISDVCVPLSHLAELISRSKQELDASPLICVVIAHAGDGNFHTVILFDPNQEEHRREAERLNQFMVYTALSMEGTCTGEHGVGTGKMKYLEKELGIEALQTMKRIKTALDPNNIMNPGKLIPPHVCF
ncbi:D-lactate dehydrogenase [cytochrome], mitochondrial isoform X7 [Durio zibethinus]|uniref:D-lactate dehydrogenase (cytochrome) n=1 Tax=Durio zibethinus TaxID=66656 RepID=A0A6P6AQ02_DURZI|nr:D-lactate dehydrogenase [cytochrome], mitochondrial isoform X7 [Durio zibethinus]